MTRLPHLLLAGPLALLACSSSSSPAGLAPPDTSAGSALAFVLDALDGDTLTTAEVDAHFSPTFLAAVPDATVIATFQQLAQHAPWVTTSFDGATDGPTLTAVATQGEHEYWRIALTVDATNPMLVDQLQFAMAPDLDPALQSFAAVDTAMAAVAPEVSSLAATIDATGCTSLDAVNATQTRALGSQFKLYVLATLAASVEAGTHAWSDLITIQDQYKSLSSGTFQTLQDGTQLSASDFAEQMISVSDNTAADHLLWFLGRDQVEAMLTTAQHHDPTENEPFPTTRELFDIKLLLSPADRATYEQASTADKRTMLATYDTTLDPRTFTGTWNEPIDIDKVEWFATPTDLCNVMSALKGFGDQSATMEVYKALALNPGVADLADQFEYIGYKGGSEPGVLTMSWLVQRKSDGAWRYFGAEFNNPTSTVDQDAAVYLGAAGRALLAN